MVTNICIYLSWLHELTKGEFQFRANKIYYRVVLEELKHERSVYKNEPILSIVILYITGTVLRGFYFFINKIQAPEIPFINMCS